MENWISLSIIIFMVWIVIEIIKYQTHKQIKKLKEETKSFEIKIPTSFEKLNYKPVRQSKGAAGVDLYAYKFLKKFDKNNVVREGLEIEQGSVLTLYPGERALISTGMKVSIPEGYELQIRSRSGLSLKYGICVANSPGTIDSDYRGDVGVILENRSQSAYTIRQAERIAQAVLVRHESFEFIPTLMEENLTKTERNESGFGSTGK